MKLKKLMTTVAVFGAMSFGATSANAEALAQSNLETMMAPTALQTACLTCHSNSSTGALNLFGDAWKAAGGGKPAYNLTDPQATALGALDSDGDGTNNNDELDAGTNPGVGSAAAAASSSSGGGCVAGSVATPLTMVLAMLALGFFVRRKKD